MRTPQKFILLTQGQGTHYVGMHKPWIAYSPAAAAVFRFADEVLYRLLGGRNLTDVLSDEAALGADPRVQQVGIFATTVACYRALTDGAAGGDGGAVISRERGDEVLAVCGYSLGEISALVISDGLSLADGLEYVLTRSDALDVGVRSSDGQATIVCGYVEAELQRLIDGVRRHGEGEGEEEGEEVLTITNKTADTIFVISGHRSAVQRLLTAVANEQANNKQLQALPLGNLPAFHTTLMEPARPALRQAIARITRPKTPAFLTLSSCTAQPFDRDNMHALLELPLTNRLRWDRCLSRLVALQATHGNATFVELAPGDNHFRNAHFLKPPLEVTNYNVPPLPGAEDRHALRSSKTERN